MHTIRLQTIHASVDITRMSLGGYQVNKFEQVFSDDHQMSLARGPDLMSSGVQGAGLGQRVS